MSQPQFDVICDVHKRHCLLKTGMNQGPNYHKSFFICPEEKCNFVKKAAYLPATCSTHKDCFVELQARIFSRSSQEIRFYHRCMAGRQEGVKWCGFTSDHPAKAEASCADEQKVPATMELPKKPVITNDADRHQTKHTHGDKGACDMDLSLGRNTSDSGPQKNGQSSVFKSSDSSAAAQHVSSCVNISSSVKNVKTSATGDDKVKCTTTSEGATGGPLSFGDLAKAAVSDKSSRGHQHTTAVNDSFSYRNNSAIMISDDEDEKPVEKPHSAGDLKTHKRTVDITNSASQSDGQGLRVYKLEGRPNQVVQTVLVEKRPQSTSSVNENSKPLTNITVRGLDHCISNEDILQQVDHKRNILLKELAEKENLLRKFNGMLPDGGAKLRSRIMALTKDLEMLQMTDDSRDVSGASARSHSSTAALSAPFKPPRVPEVSVPSSKIASLLTNSSQPLRQTQLTNYVPLPGHVQQQMYNEDRSHPNLYGGRMTASRLFQVGQVTSEAIEQLHRQFESMPEADWETDDPEGINVPLLLHQRQALTWLIWREKQKPAGGILADDMGLGKTLTMISLILKQREAVDASDTKEKPSDTVWLNRDGRALVKSNATLVVCPASLVHQWKNEIERRVGRGLLDIVLFHGPNRDCTPSKLSAADVVLTTYNIVSREVGIPEQLKNDKHAQDMPAVDTAVDSAVDGSVLMGIIWHRVIIDEAHCIKNHKSLTAMTVCRLRATNRWALTGTPIQNNLLDMYALLRFLRCTPFDELKVWKRQVDNKTDKGMQRLNTLIKTLLLRRTKDQTNAATGKPLVALPSKHVVTHELQLSEDERQLYSRLYKESQASVQEYLRQHEEKLLEKIRQEGGACPASNPWAGDDFYRPVGAPGSAPGAGGTGGTAPRAAPLLMIKSAPRGGQILIYLLRLRQCCSHPGIMKGAVDVEALQAEGLDLDLVDQMKDLAVGIVDEGQDGSGDEKRTDLSSVFDCEASSTKITELVKMLVDVRDKSPSDFPVKSVVVSQWVTMLDVVEQHLIKKGFRCCTIKGNVAIKQRSQIVDSFNSDPRGPTVLLVSLRAGGVGLNLVGGSHLFLIDMHWNPALEQQACDRIYRVGQKRDVYIHRFVCKDTIEEKILQLQQRKLTLAANVLTGAGASVDKLTLDDLKMLFGLESR